MSIKKIKVDLQNLDDITKSTLTFFLNSNLCSYTVINEFGLPDLIIFDHSRGISEEAYKGLITNNIIGIVLYQTNTYPDKRENTLLLEKPIRVDILQKILKQAYDLIQENKKTQNKPSDKTNSSQIFSDEENSILSTLTNKKKSNIENKEQIPGSQTHISTKTNSKEKSKRSQGDTTSNPHLFQAITKNKNSDKQNRYKAHKHVGSNKDIDPTNNQELETIYLTPKKYLYYHLSRALSMAKANNSDIRIKTVFGSILYDNKAKKFYYSFNKSKIKSIQTSPLFFETDLSCIKIKPDLKKLKPSFQHAKQMIWNSAIFASKGRIPQGIDVNKPIQMKNWPNYPKLRTFRHIIQISATWSQHRLSLIKTAAQLNIPQRYVFTLFCAMHATKCAAVGAGDFKSTSISNTKSKSIFTKILAHLFKKQ